MMGMLAFEIAACNAWDVLIESPIEGVEGARPAGAKVICDVPRICCAVCEVFALIAI